jgi:hypothetical protein
VRRHRASLLCRRVAMPRGRVLRPVEQQVPRRRFGVRRSEQCLRSGGMPGVRRVGPRVLRGFCVQRTRVLRHDRLRRAGGDVLQRPRVFRGHLRDVRPHGASLLHRERLQRGRMLRRRRLRRAARRLQQRPDVLRRRLRRLRFGRPSLLRQRVHRLVLRHADEPVCRRRLHAVRRSRRRVLPERASLRGDPCLRPARQRRPRLRMIGRGPIASAASFGCGTNCR